MKIDSTSFIILHPCQFESNIKEDKEVKPQKQLYWKPTKLVLHKEYQNTFDSTKEISSSKINQKPFNISTSSANANGDMQHIKIKNINTKILHPINLYNNNIRNNIYESSDSESDNDVNQKTYIGKTNRNQIKEEKSTKESNRSEAMNDNLDCGEKKMTAIKKKTKESRIKMNTKSKKTKKPENFKKQNKSRTEMSKIVLSKTTTKGNIKCPILQENNLNNKKQSTYIKSKVKSEKKHNKSDSGCNCLCLIV